MTGLTVLGLELKNKTISTCEVGTWFMLDVAMAEYKNPKLLLKDIDRFRKTWNDDDKKCPKKVFKNREDYRKYYQGKADSILLIPSDKDCFINIRNLYKEKKWKKKLKNY